MSENESRFLEIGSKQESKVTAALEAQEMMREAFPIEHYGKGAAAIGVAYKFMRKHVTQKPFTLRRARALYNGEIRRFDAEEKDALRLALVREAMDEQQRLRARLATLDARIAAFDENRAG